MVEDYGHVGLTLRQHPVSFLRAELARRRHITCAEAMSSRDRRWVEVAGLVLVRQRRGSAKGVTFITIEDETGVANLVVWTKVFEANRRTVLGAGMMGVRGRIRREGEVIHLVAHSLTDLSKEFASVGRRGRSEDALAGGGEVAAPRMPPAQGHGGSVWARRRRDPDEEARLPLAVETHAVILGRPLLAR